MNFAKPFGSAEIDKSTETEVEGNIRELTRGGAAFRQGDSSDGEMTANNLSTLLRRVSGSSTRQIDNLIGELRTLREKLQSDGDRVQRDIVEYAALEPIGDATDEDRRRKRQKSSGRAEKRRIARAKAGESRGDSQSRGNSIKLEVQSL